MELCPKCNRMTAVCSLILNRLDNKEARIKELEEGIEKHKNSPIICGTSKGGGYYDKDEELYKLIEKKKD